jgi:rSAM/selenodomain-associated transferase 1
MSVECGLVLFTKPAIPGRVKTRLIGELTARETADLHAAFRDDLLERLQGGGFDLSVAWALEGGEEIPVGAVRGFEQEGHDLGERLYNALHRLSADHAYVAAVGSDHPLLGRDQVEQAFEWLAKGADVVIGPATDGGYYLIAIRAERLSGSIFEDIAWSTESVRAQTVERCTALGLEIGFLDEASDVDTAADLRRLEQALSATPSLFGSRTRTLLERWGRLEPV